MKIDLQDGFENDEVVVKLDGREVFHKSGVSTDPRISRADGFDTSSTKAEGTVELDLPKKGKHATQSVKPGETPHIGISIRDGQPLFRTQSQPFLYM